MLERLKHYLKWTLYDSYEHGIITTEYTKQQIYITFFFQDSAYKVRYSNGEWYSKYTMQLMEILFYILEKSNTELLDENEKLQVYLIMLKNHSKKNFFKLNFLFEIGNNYFRIFPMFKFFHMGIMLKNLNMKFFRIRKLVS
jgi:hypothetical protein